MLASMHHVPSACMSLLLGTHATTASDACQDACMLSMHTFPLWHIIGMHLASLSMRNVPQQSLRHGYAGLYCRCAMRYSNLCMLLVNMLAKPQLEPSQ